MAWFKRKKTETQVKESVVSVVTKEGYSGAAAPDVAYDKLARESYMTNVVAFRCIDLIAKSVASVHWQMFERDAEGKEQKLENHPLNRVLKRANPQESFAAVIERIMAYHLIGGNGYMERVKVTAGMNAGQVRELYTHRPDRITVQRTGLNVTGYKYQWNTGSVEWLIDPVTQQCDLLHLKTFAPLDDFYGWGITMSAAGELDSSNDANTWNRTMFKNGCRPGTIFKFSRAMTSEQYERMKQQFDNKYSGPNNAGKTIVIDNAGKDNADVDVQPFGWNPKEMDFTESENKMARRIAFAYGVPPQLVGIPGDNTYANYKEARESFWEDTVAWYLNLLASEINNWLLPDERIYAKPLLDDSPAMEAKKNKNLEMAQKCDFLTINEKRNLAGFAPIEGGDVMLMGMGLSPFLGEDKEDDEDPSDTEDNIEDEEEQAKTRLLLLTGNPDLVRGDYE